MAGNRRLIDANACPCIKCDRLGNCRPGICESFAEWWFASVDAMEVAYVKEFAQDVVYQFGYYCMNRGRLHITHGGLSTMEWEFGILGWENPHPVTECECEIEGCHEHATCGTPTADGYKRVCGRHFAKMDGDGNG